jgi:molecular chaperone GrpE (heat shock protein)
MEAVKNKDVKEEECKNVIENVLMKGYRIDGKVVRAARVIVK